MRFPKGLRSRWLRDKTQARKARRTFPGPIGASLAQALELSAPRRRLPWSAIIVGCELAFREDRRICTDRKSIGGIPRDYVRAAYSTLARHCEMARSTVQIAIDRLVDSGDLIRINVRIPDPDRPGRMINDSNRYRFAWWARERWGLEPVEAFGQAIATITEIERDAAAASAPPRPEGRHVLEFTDVQIAEAVNAHIAEKWRRLGPMLERAGYTREGFRAEEMNKLRSQPASYLRSVLPRRLLRRVGGNDPPHVPPRLPPAPV